MQPLIFQTLDLLERIQILEENANEVLPSYEYDQKLNDEEIAELRTEYANFMIEVERLNEERKRLLEEINEQLKGKKKASKIALDKIRTGRERVIEKCFILQDDDTGYFGTYNSKGELLHERPPRKGEWNQKSFKFMRSEPEAGELSQTG